MSLFDRVSDGVLSGNQAIEDTSNAVRGSGPVQAYKGAVKMLGSYPYAVGNMASSMLKGEGYKPGLEEGSRLFNEGKDQFFGGNLDLVQGAEKLAIGDKAYNTKYKKYEGVDQDGTMNTGALMNTNKPVSFADMGKEYDTVLQGVKTGDNKNRFDKIQAYKDGGASRQEIESSLKSTIKDPGELKMWGDLVNQMYPDKIDPLEKVKTDQQKAMEHSVANKADGKGDATGNVIVELPDYSHLDEGEYSMTRAAERVATRMETPENWYESDAFNAGLLSFGINLLSGNDLATSFGGATKSFSEHRGVSQRRSYRDEMIADGYEPFAVDQWVQSGNQQGLKKSTAVDQWVDEQKHGMVGQTNQNTGVWNPYNKDVQAFAARSNGGLVLGGGGKGDFKANPQITIGSATMPAANANWNTAYSQKQNEEYPMMGATGRISAILGEDGALGSTFHGLPISDDLLQAKGAEEAWMQSYGRPLSGGAITPVEWKSWGRYLFPRPEDANDPQAILRKQLMRDNIAYTITGLKDQGKFPEEVTKASSLMGREITKAQSISDNVADFLPKTGVYIMKDGRHYHPAYGYLESEK